MGDGALHIREQEPDKQHDWSNETVHLWAFTPLLEKKKKKDVQFLHLMHWISASGRDEKVISASFGHREGQGSVGESISLMKGNIKLYAA